jgi:hypothetical protein
MRNRSRSIFHSTCNHGVGATSGSTQAEQVTVRPGIQQADTYQENHWQANENDLCSENNQSQVVQLRQEIERSWFKLDLQKRITSIGFQWHLVHNGGVGLQGMDA